MIFCSLPQTCWKPRKNMTTYHVVTNTNYQFVVYITNRVDLITYRFTQFEPQSYQFLSLIELLFGLCISNRVHFKKSSLCTLIRTNTFDLNFACLKFVFHIIDILSRNLYIENCNRVFPLIIRNHSNGNRNILPKKTDLKIKNSGSLRNVTKETTPKRRIKNTTNPPPKTDKVIESTSYHVGFEI